MQSSQFACHLHHAVRHGGDTPSNSAQLASVRSGVQLTTQRVAASAHRCWLAASEYRSEAERSSAAPRRRLGTLMARLRGTLPPPDSSGIQWPTHARIGTGHGDVIAQPDATDQTTATEGDQDTQPGTAARTYSSRAEVSRRLVGRRRSPIRVNQEQRSQLLS